MALPPAVFRLAPSVTNDARVAAACAVVCLGTVPTAYGPARYLLARAPVSLLYPVFLRRHVPALALPAYFGFLALVWRGRPCARRARTFALAAGFVIDRTRAGSRGALQESAAEGTADTENDKVGTPQR